MCSTNEEIQYVLGLAFNTERDHVVLIEKNKPVWQKGKLNGIGGKIEQNEWVLEAMVREFFEETGIETVPNEWTKQCKLQGQGYSVFVFRAFTNAIFNAKTMESEHVTVKPVCIDLLASRGVSNLPWLVAMALDDDADRFCPTIEYSA